MANAVGIVYHAALMDLAVSAQAPKNGGLDGLKQKTPSWQISVQ